MGPLAGLNVVEMAGLGPAPLCGMLLADLGANVVTIQRRSNNNVEDVEFHERGKQSIALNLKSEEGLKIAMQLIEKADALIEGFRPGVMERLGLGPDVCLEKNPKIVFGRMTGWGQTGPLSQAAGHDINYIALTGALHAIGPKDGKPVVPLNLVGDNGGGALYLAFGVMCGVFEAQRSGKGQVVDAAMIEGASSLMTLFYSHMAKGKWQDQRGVNLLDGGTPFYDTYETKDGKYISLGPLEPQFYTEFVERAQLDKDLFGNQVDVKKWPQMADTLTEVFKQKTRDEWCDILEGTDACFAPILSMKEAPKHPHNVERETFIEIDGHVHPAPAPKFSRTAPAKPQGATVHGAATDDVLKTLGYSQEECDALREQGVLT